MVPENDPIVSFIVPCLNEELNLPPLFERLEALERALSVPCEIVVVDDASDDRTLEVAREAAERNPAIRPVHKPLPHGLGRGVRAGIDEARGRMAVVVMADGVDPLEEAVPAFCQKILDENCDLVLLSRYTQEGDADSIPLSYKVSHSMFRFCTGVMLGIPHRDTTYAFRAFNLGFVKQLGLRSTGFEISPEITFRVNFEGGKIGEVPGAQTRRIHGKSNFLFSKAAVGYSKAVMLGIWLRLRRLVSPRRKRGKDAPEEATERRK